MTAHIHLIGRLGRDPVTRQAGDKPICELTIASDVGTKDNPRTVWYRATIWGTRGQTAARLLSKGRRVYLVGRHDEDHWTDKDGKSRVTQCIKDATWDFADDAPRTTGDQAPAPSAKPLADGRPIASAPVRPTDDEPPF